MRQIPQEYIEDTKSCTIEQIQQEINSLIEDIKLQEEEIKLDKSYLDFLYRELHDRKVKKNCCANCQYFLDNWSVCTNHTDINVISSSVACKDYCEKKK